MYDIKYAIKYLKKEMPKQGALYNHCLEGKNWFIFNNEDGVGGIIPYIVNKQTGEHKWVVGESYTQEEGLSDDIIEPIKERGKKEIEELKKII